MSEIGYDAVVFDLDGVIVEGGYTEPSVYRRGAAAAIDRLGVDGVTNDDLDVLGDPVDAEAIDARCRKLGIDTGEFWQEREATTSAIENEQIRRGKRGLYNDTAALSELEASLGIVSNNRQETVDFAVEWFRLEKHFDAWYGRDDTIVGFERMKPDSHYIDCALETLDVTPERTLYVGDRESDVIAARNANTDAAYLRREHNEKESLTVEPTYEIVTLGQLLEQTE